MTRLEDECINYITIILRLLEQFIIACCSSIENTMGVIMPFCTAFDVTAAIGVNYSNSCILQNITRRFTDKCNNIHITSSFDAGVLRHLSRGLKRTLQRLKDLSSHSTPPIVEIPTAHDVAGFSSPDTTDGGNGGIQSERRQAGMSFLISPDESPSTQNGSLSDVMPEILPMDWFLYSNDDNQVREQTPRRMINPRPSLFSQEQHTTIGSNSSPQQQQQQGTPLDLDSRSIGDLSFMSQLSSTNWLHSTGSDEPLQRSDSTFSIASNSQHSTMSLSSFGADLSNALFEEVPPDAPTAMDTTSPVPAEAEGVTAANTSVPNTVAATSAATPSAAPTDMDTSLSSADAATTSNNSIAATEPILDSAQEDNLFTQIRTLATLVDKKFPQFDSLGALQVMIRQGCSFVNISSNLMHLYNNDALVGELCAQVESFIAQQRASAAPSAALETAPADAVDTSASDPASSPVPAVTEGVTAAHTSVPNTVAATSAAAPSAAPQVSCLVSLVIMVCLYSNVTTL